MPSDVGKQILEDIMELIDEEMFWTWFEPSDFYSSLKNAFADEGIFFTSLILFGCNVTSNDLPQRLDHASAYHGSYQGERVALTTDQ